jgi:Skp family chaperone for outer membrane proteins
MRKQFLFTFLALIVFNTIHSQTRGTKIGYIDMEYILQNVPNYTEASNQLEDKAQKWKQEIEAKKIVTNKLKETLAAEKALLTKELIEERETEIKFLETETLDYQQKRFGPNGDLMLQKTLLTKPIQDQVFTAIQDIAETQKYDFIFDKSSDLTMIFAAKRFDISDQVLRVLNRAEKREQLTKKEQAAKEAKENKEDAIEDNPFLAERQKAIEEKKAARDKFLEDRKLAQEAKKKEYEDKRNKILADKAAKKNGTVSASTKTEESNTSKTSDTTAVEKAKIDAAEVKQKQNETRAKALEDRKKVIEDRKKALEEKRIKVLEEREAAKKALEEKRKQPKQ